MTQKQDELTVQAYSLWEFCKEITAAAQQGYMMDTDSNDRAPQNFGSQYYTIMIKKPVVEEQQEQPVPVDELEIEPEVTEEVTKQPEPTPELVTQEPTPEAPTKKSKSK